MYKLLIADDEAIEREALKYIIEKSDLPIESITEASNGQEAISVAAVSEPDIIIMDIKMPGLDGIESSKIIRKIKAETKIIFLTAFDEFDHAKAGIELNVEAFLVKPSPNERIIEVLKNTIAVLERESHEKANQAQVEEKLMQMSKYLESEFLTSVITGNLSEKQLAEYQTFMSIEENFGFGVTISLNYNEDERDSDLRKQMLKKRVIEKLAQRSTSLHGKTFVTHVKDMIYLLLVTDTKEKSYNEQDRAKAMVIALSDELQKDHQVYFDVGIGDVKEGFQNLWQSFTIARNAVHKKVYTRQDPWESEILPIIIRCIIECDEEALHTNLDSIGEQFTSTLKDMDVLRVKLYEFIILFNQSILSEIAVVLEPSEGVFRRVMTIKTLGGLQTYIREYLHQVMTAVQEMKSDKTMVIMDKLIAYINSHYNECITLEQLGNMSGFSPFYLSKVFKKHVDMNFSDYLVFVRMKVAKRMLKNPTKSIKEISMEVGYTDPNYFSRVFRKAEQMTPTAYRCRYMVL